MPVRVTFAGRLAFAVHGRTLDGTLLPGRQSRAALAYLVDERDRLVPSEELAEVLWGETPPPTWHPALRGVISRVRGFLFTLGLPAAEMLKSSAGGYQLMLPPGATVDVEEAASGTEQADQALRVGDLDRALALAAAARAVAGRPLLPGQEGAWVERRRAALRAVLVRSLEVLAEAHLGAGRADLAVEPAKELVRLEPFRESAHLRLLRVHAAAGNRAEALRAYHDCRMLLAEELGVDPSPELEAVYLGVLRAGPHRAGGRQPWLTEPESPAGVFVGRDNELARMGAAWARTRAGQRQIVVVTGEAGSGKSRLVDELVRMAVRDGGTVLSGRCDERARTDYFPFRQAFGRKLTGAAGGELTRFWPEVSLQVPDPPRGPVTAQTGRRELFEAVTGLLAAMAATGPLVLLIDDLHLADEPSLALLRHLAHDRHPQPLLIVAACATDQAADAGLTMTLADLERVPGAEHLALAGLSPDEVAALAEAGAGWPPGLDGVALADLLHGRTGGNPLLVTELVQHLLQAGAHDGEALLRMAAHDIPEPVRLAVNRRLARLGDVVRQVLEAAAVLGANVELALLTRVADLGHEALLGALHTAVEAKLLDEEPCPPVRYVFHQRIVRDLLYAELGAAPRALLHHRVGVVLQELPPGGPARLRELADHFALGSEPGDAGMAAGYARLAGDHARARLLYEEAAQRYQQALAALERADAGDEGTRCDLLLVLAEAWTKAGQTQRATGAYLQAADAARTTGSAERLGRAALGLGGPAGFWSLPVSMETAIALLREAFTGLGPDRSALRALLLARMASWRLLASLAGDGDGHAQDEFEDAVTMARQSGDRRTLAAVRAEQAHAWSGTVLGRPAGPGGMLAATAELDRLAAGLGDDEMAYQASLTYGEALLTAGDVAGVDRLIQREERLAREHGVAYRAWVPLVQRWARAVMGGDFVQGERIAERALAVGRGPLGEAAVVAHAVQMVLLRWLQGRPSEVEAALDAAIKRSSPQLGWSRLYLLAHVGHGRQAQVRRDLDAAVAREFAGRSSATDVVALVGACALLGDEDAASRLYGLLRSWSGWHIVAGHHYLGAADHHLGILAATAGRWSDAERHLSRALVSHRRLRARPWFALTADAFAGMLRCRGESHDQHRAGQFEGTALALAAAHGMTLPDWASAGLGPRARRAAFVPGG